MRTTTPTPEEMERYIARFEDLPANKDRTAGKIPPEAREMMTARATRTVQQHARDVMSIARGQSHHNIILVYTIINNAL